MSERTTDAPSGRPAVDRREAEPAPHSARILALIPAWNEAPTLGPIVTAVREMLPVLVVDDGSTDATAEVARRSGAIVVSHEVNRRKGAALMTGFAWALEQGYDAVVTLDADGQHDPADLSSLLSAFRDGAGDLIIGERTFSEMPFPRWFTTPLGSRVLSCALGVRVTDNQSGYRVLSRRFLEAMRLTSTGFEMEVEMIWEAIRLGLPIGWVPIRTIYLPERKSGFHPLKDSARFLRMVWHIWRQRRRHEAALRA
ncbi:MAG: glycosyltransferase family 2 protein [Chloroflexi bacterium]|nr:glycosyltransferase family 2 protein [Chloroflexota bacterium]